MKIVLPGGNGFIGRLLAERWQEAGHEVVVLTRSPSVGQIGRLHDGVERSGTCADQNEVTRAARGVLRSAQDDARPPVKVGEVVWDGKTIGEWAAEIDGSDVLLNLAGRNVNCRYTEFNKGVIRDSRLESTRVLGEAVALAANPPRVWLNSSTATIYRHAEDRPMDDETGEIGSGFSVEVAKAWEDAFFSCETPLTRKVALRTAIVMGVGEGGAFSVFDTLAQRTLGGRMGDGKQMVSWVHIEDLARAIEFLIESDLEGTVNVSAPGPLRNDAFMEEIVKARGAKIALPSPKWLLEIGAVLLRTETELPLKSRWVVPSRLLCEGFEFMYQTWPQAVRVLTVGP